MTRNFHSQAPSDDGFASNKTYIDVILESYFPAHGATKKWHAKYTAYRNSGQDSEVGQIIFGTRRSPIQRAVGRQLQLHKLTDESGLLAARIASALHTQDEGPGVNPLLVPWQRGRLSSALESCRMVDYFTHNNERSQGCLLLMFPLRVAYTHLSGKLPQITSCLGRTVWEMPNSMRFQISEHLLDIGANH